MALAASLRGDSLRFVTGPGGGRHVLTELAEALHAGACVALTRARAGAKKPVARVLYGAGPADRPAWHRWMNGISSWHIVGDWFDNCSCAVPCPCTFAQAPDNGFCESVLFWHVREGHYGGVKLDRFWKCRISVGP
jgi:hypothetical protein